MHSLGVFNIYLALRTNTSADTDLITGVEIIHWGCLMRCVWLARYLQQAIIDTTSPN